MRHFPFFAVLLLAVGLAGSAARAQTSVGLAFDGVDDSVSLPAILTTGTSYTLEAWVYYTGGNQNAHIISAENNRFWLQGGVLKAGRNGVNVVSDTLSLPVNTWVHVAVTFDANVPVTKLYRNGRLVAQSSSSQPYTGGAMALGAYLTDANPAGSEFWPGRMDEVRVWDAARSQGEILAHMNTELVGNEVGLRAYYRFSEGSPGGENQGQETIIDSAGANNGSPNNFALTGPDSNYSAGFTPLAPGTGRALAFDGSGDFVLTVLDADADVLPDTTWEAWIYPTTNDSATRLIFSIEDGGFDRAVAIFGNDFRVFTKTPNYWVPAQISLNQWQHIAVVYAGSAVRFYKNGVESTGPATAQTNNTTTRMFALGAHPGGNSFFAGCMDEVRVWNYAREKREITADMNKELAGNESGLVAYYDFNQGDAHANNVGLLALVDGAYLSDNHGTLNGFALAGTNSNWVAPGFSQTPDIEVRGKNIAIVRGDTTPATADGTQFGLVPVANGIASRSFIITNTGSGPLIVGAINVTGANAADFSVNGISFYPTNVAIGGSVRFTVRFDPSAEGVQDATITVISDDPDEASYGFAVQGTGGTPTTFVAGEVFTSGNTGVSNIGSGGDFTGATPLVNPGFSFGQFAWSASLRTMYLTIYSAGKVVAIKPDGTVTNFATGLSAPTGLLRTADGRLLVGEETSGQVTDITAGGDFTGATPFASGLSGVRSLIQGSNGKIYAAESYRSAVTEITGGGGITTNAILADQFPGQPTDLAFHPVSGRLLVVVYGGHAVYEITGPDTIAEFASGQNFIGIAVDSAGRVLAQCAGSADIFDITAAGDFFDALPLAEGFSSLDQALDAVSAPAPAPIISVLGNGNAILNGATNTGAANFTDFGNVAPGSSLLRPFTVASVGGAALTINGISVSGTNAANFLVGGLTFPMTIAASNSTLFTVTFSPGATGLHTATISVSSTDLEAGDYNFAVQGTGGSPPPPVLAVQRSGTNAVVTWTAGSFSDTLEVVTTNAAGRVQWGNASFTPALNGTNYQVTVPLATGTNKLFRVRRQ